jgi:hypothetical protein
VRHDRWDPSRESKVDRDSRFETATSVAQTLVALASLVLAIAAVAVTVTVPEIRRHFRLTEAPSPSATGRTSPPPTHEPRLPRRAAPRFRGTAGIATGYQEGLQSPPTAEVSARTDASVQNDPKMARRPEPASTTSPDPSSVMERARSLEGEIRTAPSQAVPDREPNGSDSAGARGRPTWPPAPPGGGSGRVYNAAGQTVWVDVQGPDPAPPRRYKLKSHSALCLPEGAKVRARLDRNSDVQAEGTVAADTDHSLVRPEGFDVLLMTSHPQLRQKCPTVP